MTALSPAPEVLRSVLVSGECPGDLPAIASGALAEGLAALFVEVGEAIAPLAASGQGGGVLVVVGTAEPRPSAVVVTAVGALVRSLARESADQAIRVNAVITETGSDHHMLLDFLSGPAAAMLTGAAFDARPTTPVSVG